MTEEQHSSPALSLHTLTVGFLTAADRGQLAFQVLNNCVRLCGYQRAVFFRLRGKKAKFLAVSGRPKVDNYSEMVEKWVLLASHLEKKEKPQILASSNFSGAKETAAFSFLEKYSGRMTVYWLPLTPWGRLRYGLWFERWGQQTWQAEEINLLNLAGIAVRAALERLEPDTLLHRVREKILQKYRLAILCAILLAVILCWRIPLRVVAPCEIVPKDPFVVTAPLSGVVAEVVVNSGEQVKKEATLFTYDPRVVQEELNIARQQVKILDTGIKVTRINALTSADAKAELAIMEYKRKQEQIRLRMAEYQAAKLIVKAEVAGEVIPIANPDEWRGRPVEMGEKVLILARSGEILLRLWISEADNVQFAGDTPVKVLLNAMPDRSFTAELDYIAKTVTLSTDGVPSVMAEGGFTGVNPEQEKLLRIGLKGNAIIYGEEVSVAYWLLRKPWTSARKILGW